MATACGRPAALPRAPLPSPLSAEVIRARQQAELFSDRKLREPWQVATAIAASGDDTARRTAAAHLLARARAIRAPAWRDEHSEELRAANAASKLAPTEEQFDAQLALYQSLELDGVIDAMVPVGGPDVLAHCFEIAESAAVPEEQRWSAMVALEALVDPSDRAATARRLAAATRWRMAAQAAKPVRALHIVQPDASVIQSLRSSLEWRCYTDAQRADPHFDAALGDDPRVQVATRLVLELDAVGAVSRAVVEGSFSASFVHCLEHEGRLARFGPRPGGEETVALPITFVLPP